ncbi:MAG TPA: 6-hydroxymethylpterin diphosphokinase MptE-like protein [Candidatus Thermoplasmatota archaeon]|nr:6-hydroxymethylpterin diphosphokinase MptE-like protein [Candidatus Thermoplasmatota archaeon]
MNWTEWEPRYEAILKDFRWPREADEAARDELANLLFDHPGLVEWTAVEARLRGREAVVYGAAPYLSPFPATPEGKAAVVADKALPRAMSSHVFPDVLVTDLDGDLNLLAEVNQRGALLVVHAHGDNRHLLRSALSRFPGPLLGTCQCEPTPLVLNTGGFTDGDRACFLAEAAGATALHLQGFDFQTVGASGPDRAMKARKLAWAARLLGDLRVPVLLPSGAPYAPPAP